MPNERQWTGSVSDLPKAMRELAIEMSRIASAGNAPRDESDANQLAGFLQDHAYTLSEWADAVEQLYARLDQGEIPTNAQGVALARFLRPQFRDTVHPADRRATVTRGGAGLSDTYLLVTLPGGYQGGIDHEGRVST